MLALAALRLTLAAAAPATDAPRQPVPFVGCRSDGQTGREDAPRGGPTPRVSAAAAPRLAYYGIEDLGVLAPRGWHCVGLRGSNGLMVIVTPDVREPLDLIGPAPGIAGPGVSVSLMFGETSGRFAVANAIARYFPGYRAFARRVSREGVRDEPLPAGPWAADEIERRGPNEVRFKTPAGSRGAGTSSLFAPQGGAVSGAVVLLPADEPDLVAIRVRLPDDMTDLSLAIIDESPALRP